MEIYFEAITESSRVRNVSLFVLIIGELASRLQEASVKIINRNTCNKLYDDAVTSRMLCAGNLLGGVDACQVSVCVYLHGYEFYCEILVTVNTPQIYYEMKCCNAIVVRKCTSGY